MDPAPVPTLLLRMAAWQASNCGLRGELLDFGTLHPGPGRRRWCMPWWTSWPPCWRSRASWNWSAQGVDRILAEGTGSQLQREPFHAGGLAAVVERAVDVTTQGADRRGTGRPAPRPWVAGSRRG